jgi:hypothetical protein
MKLKGALASFAAGVVFVALPAAPQSSTAAPTVYEQTSPGTVAHGASPPDVMLAAAHPHPSGPRPGSHPGPAPHHPGPAPYHPGPGWHHPAPAPHRFEHHRPFGHSHFTIVAPPLWWEPYGAYPAPTPAPAYWYYCQSANAYYPYAPSCPEPWVVVPAVPQ